MLDYCKILFSCHSGLDSIETMLDGRKILFSRHAFEIILGSHSGLDSNQGRFDNIETTFNLHEVLCYLPEAS